MKLTRRSGEFMLVIPVSFHVARIAERIRTVVFKALVALAFVVVLVA